jgi:hypothetical protein
MPSTRSFTPTRQGNPCLVCGDIKGRCRQTAEDLNLCMDSSGVLPGFHYLGQTKDGLWAKYILDDGQEQNQADRIREQQQLRAQRAAAEAQRHADALSAMERESFAPRVRLYNQLLHQLPLHPDDRADLNRRGITDEQIEAVGFKSVEQWQPLTQELSHALPGISLDGRSFVAKLSPITYQNLIGVIERNPNIESIVSQNPLKRLTRAKNRSLIDQSKEVISDKWCFKRKKTPTWQKEF